MVINFAYSQCRSEEACFFCSAFIKISDLANKEKIAK